jgi:hypothetical protein
VRRPLPLAIACLLLGFAGCGNSRVHAPDPETARDPGGWSEARFGASGVSLLAPRNWALRTGTAPLVATLFSGAGVIAVWRYPRSEPLPSSGAAMRAARRRLVRAAQERDSTLTLRQALITRVGGSRAIVLVAAERVNGHPRVVRSAHVFAHRSEVVVDAYAPSAQFARIDRAVFAPLVESLRLSAPPRPRAHHR